MKTLKDRIRGEKKQLPQINERIRARQMQLITHEGQNLGLVSRSQALQLAQDAGLDLVVIVDYGLEKPPVAKIMDFGKAEYEKKKKQAIAKKHQKQIKVKEIKLRPKIGEHDFDTKLNQGAKFLREGMHLKVTLMFRGRERSMARELGLQLFDRVDNAFAQNYGFTNLVKEKDMKAGPMWSRVYYVKN